MRGTWTALLCGAVGVSALPNPSLNLPDIANIVPSAIPDSGPESAIPIFVTRTFDLLEPSQALQSLHAKASATPSAVSILPGVPIPTDLINKVKHVVDEVKDSFLEDSIPDPSKFAQEAESSFSELLDSGSANTVQKGAEQDVKKVQTGAKKVAEDATAATCTNPAVRYEWRNLSDTHKLQYVNAVKCLMSKPSKLHMSGSTSLWSDLTVVHQHMNPIIHNVGQFGPWHRYYLWIFQNFLSSECGYTGPLPWWDETKDAGNFNGSPAFTSTYEGHMPDGNTVCIISGVFANTELYIGPGDSNTKHCLSRGVNEQLSASITSNFVNTCNSYTNFNDMQNCHFFGPHAYGHDAIGGVMSDVATSPGDPAFFLHHAFVDRNWRIWQRTDPGPRTYAIGGSTTQNCGNSCQPTTLNYVLTSLGLSPNITVNQVMDTQGGFLCYHYDY